MPKGSCQDLLDVTRADRVGMGLGEWKEPSCPDIPEDTCVVAGRVKRPLQGLMWLWEAFMSTLWFDAATTSLTLLRRLPIVLQN